MQKHSFLKLALAATLSFALFVSGTQSAHAVACTESGTDASRTISGTGCSLSENVSGADGGTVSIATGTSITLTADATYRQILSYTTSITLAANSSIALSKTGLGARVAKGYIYVTDADGDGYRLNSATDAVFSTTAVGGKVRRSAAASGLDSNDGQACSSGYTGYTCYTCSAGAKVLVANGADTLNQCAAAGWNGCTNLCVKTTTNTGNCNGAGACSTGAANVAAGNICSSGTEVAGACSPGYTCNGSGHCSYTDIYGEHILW